MAVKCVLWICLILMRQWLDFKFFNEHKSNKESKHQMKFTTSEERRIFTGKWNKLLKIRSQTTEQKKTLSESSTVQGPAVWWYWSVWSAVYMLKSFSSLTRCLCLLAGSCWTLISAVSGTLITLWMVRCSDQTGFKSDWSLFTSGWCEGRTIIGTRWSRLKYLSSTTLLALLLFCLLLFCLLLLLWWNHISAVPSNLWVRVQFSRAQITDADNLTRHIYWNI